MERSNRGVVGLVVAAAVALAAGPAQATIVGRDGVSGFYTPDDGYMHAVVAQTNGDITELYWANGWASPARAPLGNWPFSGIVATTGYFTAFDGYRHAAFATTAGQIWSWDYSPAVGIQLNFVTTFAPATFGNIVAMTSYVTGDRFEHIVVATDQNRVSQFRFSNYVANSGSIQPIGVQYPDPIASVSTTPDGNGNTVLYVATRAESRGANFVTVGSSTSTANTPFTIHDDTPYTGGNVIGVKITDRLWDTSWATQTTWGYGILGFGPERLIGGPYWPFTYGPQVVAFGEVTDPTTGAHGLTAMSNGDLWNMFRSGGVTTWTWLGAF